ncbi:hypothetical protein ACR75P_05145 [Faecalicoccus pleomorphus]|uniref:hypothetical protein n=1 Tax=Faecalicoccus pleomorphus TaxID=1323 RepID=UPI003DA34DD8
MNKITLTFDRTLSHIAGNLYGQEVYKKQLENKISIDQVNEIWFPDQIKGVSISFIQGMIKDLVNMYGKDTVLRKISLKSNNAYLQKRLERNIRF